MCHLFLYATNITYFFLSPFTVVFGAAGQMKSALRLYYIISIEIVCDSE